MGVLDSLRNALRIPELRRRLAITLGLLVAFRLGSHIALPGVSAEAVEALGRHMQEQWGGVWVTLRLFSAGAMEKVALFSMGIMPYITASIVMQLVTKLSPRLEAVARDGPSGQRTISRYTRWLTVPIAVVQSVIAVNALAPAQVLLSTGWATRLEVVAGMTAGALLVMWLGEQVTEHGVGNGASLFILAGIVARLPAMAATLVEKQRHGEVAGEAVAAVAALFLAMIAAVVFVTQAQRRIQVRHAKHVRGRRVSTASRNYLPLRVNTAGVMPVVFATSLLVVPQALSHVPGLAWMRSFVTPGTFAHASMTAAMIFFFGYFWTYLFFPPREMAGQLKEHGSFVPGLRPGETTARYLDSVLARVTLCGAAFLASVALAPALLGAGFGGPVERVLHDLLGGAAILIAVGVALDVVQKIESHLLLHHYEGFARR